MKTFIGKLTTILLVLNVFSLINIHAVKNDAELFLNDFVIKNWTTADGLSGNTITDVIQGSDGYLYIGSYEGLVRFDGIQFTVLKRGHFPGVDFVSARTVFEDSKQNLWIGANDEGVTCIGKDGKISLYNSKNGLTNNSVRAICEDKSGKIWIGTSSGIVCITEKGVSEPAGIEFLPKDNRYMIKKMFCDSDGIVWIITEDTGEAFYYKDDSFYAYGAFSSVKENQFTAVYQAADGAMWFGVAPYYAVRVKDRKETLYTLDYGRQKALLVTNIYEDREGKVWISLDNGIVVIDGERQIYLAEEDGLADNKVSKIIEDTEGDYWIATDRGGIEKLSHTKFHTISVPSTVNAIAEDNFRNCVWIGADDGLYCLKNDEFESNKITEMCKKVRIRHVALTDDGKLLISAYAKLGQVEVSLDGRVRSWKKENGLAGNKVRTALQTKKGDLYIGTTTGLTIINTKNEVIEIKKGAEIANDYIMCLYEDSEGNVWCGTDGGGIFILKNEAFYKSYSTNSGLVGNVIFKIKETENGEIWITTGTGLSILKDGKFVNFNSLNGLGSDSVFQALDDGTGKVWFTNNTGIFSVKNEYIEDVVAGKKSAVESKFYGVSDGFKTEGITSTSLSMKDKDGNLWFTLIDGIAKYNSGKSVMNQTKPVVHIEDVMIDSVKIEKKDNVVTVLPSQNRININYTGLSFVNPEQIKFKTKLEGFDSDFSEWTTERHVSYTNLSPKTYKFKVIAMSGDEVLSESEEALTIIKKPAFYQHKFTWILAFIFLVILAIEIVKTRVVFLKNERTKLENIVNERTAELTELKEGLEKQVVARTAELQHEKERVQTLSVEVTMALSGTIDAKDTYTKGHSQRVAEYSKMIAAAAGKDEEYQNNIYYIAILHDIGKIGVPDTIINKTGKLTDEEFDIIRKHPEIGSDILKSIKSMPEVSVGARWHHERYDGRGYPDGLRGEMIPEIARIICVADSYDAMTSNRSYRKYLPQEAVREEIIKCRGTQFDPLYADIMISLIDADKNYTMHE